MSPTPMIPLADGDWSIPDRLDTRSAIGGDEARTSDTRHSARGAEVELRRCPHLAPGAQQDERARGIDPVSGLAINEGDILIDDASAVVLLASSGGLAAILHPAESLGLFTIRGGDLSNGNLNALDVVLEPTTALLLGLGLAALASRQKSFRRDLVADSPFLQIGPQRVSRSVLV